MKRRWFIIRNSKTLLTNQINETLKKKSTAIIIDAASSCLWSSNKYLSVPLSLQNISKYSNALLMERLWIVFSHTFVLIFYVFTLRVWIFLPYYLKFGFFIVCYSVIFDVEVKKIAVLKLFCFLNFSFYILLCRKQGLLKSKAWLWQY